MVETSKNPWTPCPLYSFIEEEEKIEKTLEEVPQNAVQIEIESTTYDKSDAYIQVNLGKKKAFYIDNFFVWNFIIH